MSIARSLWDIIRRNKGIIIFLSLVGVAIIVWSIYVRANDDGIIEGKVVDQNGDGVAGAEVLLQKKGYDILDEPIVTTTDENGHFRYEDTPMLEFVISAQKEGYHAEGERASFHRYFMRHNYELPSPLQLVKEQNQ
jgi:hypothetical protein